MKKIVCYTCCTGGYDNVIKYPIVNPDWDYVYFTDNKDLIKQKKVGQWVVKPLQFSRLTNVKNARWHKVNAHILFPEYEYSLWLDANISIVSDNVTKKIDQLIEKEVLFSVPLHPDRNCIYEEAEAIIQLNIDYPEIVNREIKFLKKEKYPHNNGLHETCILFRKHNLLKNTLDLWWKMINKHSKRDQLSFNYAVWKNNIFVFPLYETGKEHKTNGDFLFYYTSSHNRKKSSNPLPWYKKEFKLFSKEVRRKKQGKIKKYKFLNFSIFKKLKFQNKKKLKVLGITIYKKLKKEKLNNVKITRHTLFGIPILKRIKTPWKDRIKLFSVTIHEKYIKENNLKSVAFKDMLPYLVKDIDLTCEQINDVTILIPVYNGVHHLEKLLPSLLKNTPLNVKIIIIDDCSPDPKISEFLKIFQGNKQIEIIKNDENLGFVKTVNKGMKQIKTAYAVWLNSDTIVPEKWLERLLKPFSMSDKIASLTPFTNSGTYYSYPNFAKDNQLFDTLENIDKIFQAIKCDDLKLNQSHSGCGFCMAINMNCWKEIGALDEENFGKGYGEENDWCFRATLNGWKHILVPNLFIQHCHGGSFKTEEKKILCSKHQEILKNKYPKIMNNDVPLLFKTDPWKIYRNLATLLYCKKNAILIVDFENNYYNNPNYYNECIKKDTISNGTPVLLLFKDKMSLTANLRFPSIDATMEIKLNGYQDLFELFNLINFSRIIGNSSNCLKKLKKVFAILSKKQKRFCIEIKK